MIKAPNVLMVGGCGRGVGKTAFACAVIERFASRHDIVAVKATAIDPFNRSHYPEMAVLPSPACRITEEADPHGRKDTSRMLACGAKQALWLRVADTHLREGIASLLDRLGPETVSVWESTWACRFVAAGAFIMIEGSQVGDRKPWAQELAQDADRVVFSDSRAFDIDWNDIQHLGGHWAIKMDATAILLAGGDSTRMGADKTMLPVGGRPMIRHVFEQLRPYFARVLVSSNQAAAHGFPGATVVPDEVAGRGPMMGIVSALKASSDELYFVAACDIPDVDVDLVRAMVRRARACDAVVPCRGPGRPEPLFAVYKRSVLPVFEEMLLSGNYRMTDALKRCAVEYVPVRPGQIGNINTVSEYRRHIGKARDAKS